jgi:hypothetical protein
MLTQVNFLGRREAAHSDQPTGIEERYDARWKAERALVFRGKGTEKLIWSTRE